MSCLGRGLGSGEGEGEGVVTVGGVASSPAGPLVVVGSTTLEELVGIGLATS